MRKISEIMKDLKDNYDELGLSYYPNDILERDDTKVIYKEIERLNNIIGKNKYSADELNEIERLNNIIKEVREYIERFEVIFGYYDTENYDGTSDTYSHDTVKEDLLGIIDKGE